jgi:hypothetical protein
MGNTVDRKVEDTVNSRTKLETEVLILISGLMIED